MKFITTDKNYYKKLLLIALPIAMQNLIGFSSALADTFMVGLMGELQLSAGSLAGKYGFVFMLFVFGLTSGANVLIAQFWGNGDVRSIHKVLTMMYRSLIFGIAFFSFFAIFYPENVMRIFTPSHEVIALGAEYLPIMGISYIFWGISLASMNTLRPIGSVMIAVIVNVTSLVVNASLNWILIFGKFGFPAMGMRGAAIATLISRVAEVIIILIYFIFFENKIRYGIKELFAKKLGISKLFFSTCGPVVVNEIIWSVGAALISVIIGHLGPSFTAADSVASIINQLVTITVWGVAHASSTIVGNTIGEGEHKLAKDYAYTSIFIAVVLGIISSGVVLLLRDFTIGIYNLSPETQQHARDIINMYAILVIFQSISGVGLIGIIRAGGDTKFVLLVDLIFMWAVCLPMGYIASFKLMLPVAIIYLILKSDEIFKATLVFIKLSKGNWIHDVTRSVPNEQTIE